MLKLPKSGSLFILCSPCKLLLYGDRLYPQIGHWEEPSDGDGFASAPGQGTGQLAGLDDHTAGLYEYDHPPCGFMLEHAPSQRTQMGGAECWVGGARCAIALLHGELARHRAVAQDQLVSHPGVYAKSLRRETTVWGATRAKRYLGRWATSKGNDLRASILREARWYHGISTCNLM